MKARLAPLVRLRAEAFGGIAYVHPRNDFFFLDSTWYTRLEALAFGWKQVLQCDVLFYKELAGLGICETADPAFKQRSYSGVAFLGEFEDIPKVSKPLVVNCFATAHCPLLCRYCHADDLMRDFRAIESDEQIGRVARSLNSLDSLVAVISGGDPLTRIHRTKRLLQEVDSTKAIVMDTSGVLSERSDLKSLIPLLVQRDVHVRVSLDDFADNNSRSRPINKKYVKDGRTSYSHAEETINLLQQSGIRMSVQTVLSKFNDNARGLLDFARVLVAWGVRHWVIHVTLVAGKAAEAERSYRFKSGGDSLLPEDGGLKSIRKLYRLLEEAAVPIDLRITNANPIKHAVFLVNSEGDLYTEGMAKLGKQLSYTATGLGMPLDIWKDVDPKAHVARYSNWVSGVFPDRTLSELCLRLT